MTDLGLTELWRLSAAQLVEGYRSLRFTPLDAANACLARIAACEPLVHAMVCVDAEGALEAAVASAARWRKGQPLGDLDGVPITLKDNLHARGLPTRWGSLLVRADKQAHDEAPVRLVREAGALILGKTNLPEFALQGFTTSRISGTTHNPRDLRNTPGGSSGGAAAAVAAGYSPIALATDGGGSIRRPASYCGVVGYKPSEGLVQRQGGLPDLFDGHEVVGGMARCITDVRLLARALASKPLAPASTGNARVLFVAGMGGRPVDSRIVEGVRAATRGWTAMGHTVVESMNVSWAERVHALWPQVAASGLQGLFDNAARWPGLLEASDAQGCLAACEAHSHAVYLAGSEVGPGDVENLTHAMSDLQRVLDDLFAEFDFILTPATSATAWSVDLPLPTRIEGRPAGPRADAVFTPFVNAAGLCALTFPCAWVDGQPVSLQLVGARGDDERLMEFAASVAGGDTSLPLAEPQSGNT